MSEKSKPCPLYEYENNIQITETMSFLEYYKTISYYYGISIPDHTEEMLMVLASLLMYVFLEAEE